VGADSRNVTAITFARGSSFFSVVCHYPTMAYSAWLLAVENHPDARKRLLRLEKLTIEPITGRK
jgi:hypothetical protein